MKARRDGYDLRNDDRVLVSSKPEWSVKKSHLYVLYLLLVKNIRIGNRVILILAYDTIEASAIVCMHIIIYNFKKAKLKFFLHS